MAIPLAPLPEPGLQATIGVNEFAKCSLWRSRSAAVQLLGNPHIRPRLEPKLPPFRIESAIAWGSGEERRDLLVLKASETTPNAGLLLAGSAALGKPQDHS